MTTPTDGPRDFGKQRWWVGQAACPHGVFGGVMAPLLNWGNRTHNVAVVEALAPTSTDRILDVGFGGGIGLRRVLASPAKSVTGLELSEDMVARARRVFSRELSDGRLRLEYGSADELPFADRSFDGVYSVNCIYFWRDPIRGLEEVRRVLDNDGRIVLGVDPRTKKMFKDPFRGFDREDTEEALRTAGFVDVTSREIGRNKGVASARRA